jgi:hypothetical protein
LLNKIFKIKHVLKQELPPCDWKEEGPLLPHNLAAGKLVTSRPVNTHVGSTLTMAALMITEAYSLHRRIIVKKLKNQALRSFTTLCQVLAKAIIHIVVTKICRQAALSLGPLEDHSLLPLNMARFSRTG